jgi:hypothetical protein
MDLEIKNRKKTISHNDISISKEVNSKREPEKIKRFKRFLDWLTSGANELSKGGTACPS